ncbi:response regulator [Woeseia oceani]|uniref:DNA-binding response regulator n=1 Tax=Woeseia oceani TaxID=1548547 RepID=A0A193LJM6_9GAMM|nr:response regulator transcription factor [Woeseia oceani]ANO52633.1 hypothetical protein BA177_16860 [Woeseia oceani]
MIRILIADDHALIREGLVKVFDSEPDMTVVAAASDAPTAIEYAMTHATDIVILDVNMPGTSGIEALQKLRNTRPGLPVLMLSMLPERNYAMRLLDEGASGFVSKESAADEIVDAVRQVMAGNKYLSPALAAEITGNHKIPAEPHSQLSRREFQVLRLIASGSGTRNIAEQLDLSINTVATYRRRILAKLDLKSDVEVTRFAIEHHLLD